MQPTIDTAQPPIIATIGIHANQGIDWHSFQNSLIILPSYKFGLHSQPYARYASGLYLFPDRLSNLPSGVKISRFILKVSKPGLHRSDKLL